MKYLRLTSDTNRILPYYLSVEEMAAHIIGDEDLFFMWQVDPTVIFGRNQVLEAEVNVDYCQKNGIAMYRRKSGGGTVYADRGNIMMSYITRSDDVQLTFKRYTGAVVEMLRSLGLDASDTSRNDILINGLKVSGNAFYHLPARSIVHGTMLYGTNPEHIMHAITPAAGKLASKGVSSVRSRITTLGEHLTIGIDAFKQHVRNSLCDGEITLTPEQEATVEREILPTYLTREFILGKNPRCTVSKRQRLEGVGEIAVHLELKHNTIASIELTGDFLMLSDPDRGLLDRLRNCEYTPAGIDQALSGVNVSRYIMNLNNVQFINLLTN